MFVHVFEKFMLLCSVIGIFSELVRI